VGSLQARAKRIGRAGQAQPARQRIPHGRLVRVKQLEHEIEQMKVTAAEFGFVTRQIDATVARDVVDQVAPAKWLIGNRIRSIENAVANSPEANKWLAGFAAQLPMEAKHAKCFASNSSVGDQLIEILQADLWIEKDADFLVATHDVFADALLARYIFGLPGLETARAFGILTKAMEAGRLSHTLAVFNRLAAHPGFEKINGADIAEGLLVQDRVRTLDSAASLLNSRMLQPDRAITFAVSLGRDFQNQLATATSSHFRISKLSEWASYPANRALVDSAAMVAFGDLIAVAAGCTHCQISFCVERSLSIHLVIDVRSSKGCAPSRG
jgi:hypothetical protein